VKVGFRLAALFILTLAVQRLLGGISSHPYAAAVLLPMPWIIAPPLRRFDLNWYWLSFPLGLGWDILFEPVIGPGAVAWSVPALVIWAGASIVAKRKAPMWFVSGAVGTILFWSVRALCMIPLDLPAMPTWRWLAISALVTGLWCVVVQTILTQDLPGKWRSYRSRRLR